MTSQIKSHFQMFFFGILCALVGATHCYAFWEQSELQISVPTLKSDLDYILEYTKTPTKDNIRYTHDAVLPLSVVPKPEGQGLCIKIDGPLNIKLADGTILQESNVVYSDGSLGLPIPPDTEAHIIIKRDKNIKVKPTHGTISYNSTKELTDYLVNEFKDFKENKFHKETLGVWQNVPIGSSTTTINYTPRDKRFLLQKPLKGISFHRRKSTLFDKGHRTSFTDRNASVPSDRLPSYRSKKLFGVFFDVWFDPQKGQFGSSNGPLSNVEAVRIYGDDGWHREVRKMMSARKPPAPGKRGEHIRKKALEQDLFIAYKRLYSDDPFCDNVVIEYAGEILLDVRRGSEGNHRAVTATGIRVKEAGNPISVTATYDLENLEYSDQAATEETFVPETGKRSSFFNYIDWGRFKSHLESVWTAMQGRCTKDETRVHDFNMAYGADIQVQYNCGLKTLAVVDTLFVLTDIPKTFVTEDILKAAVSKCKNVLYLPSGEINASCPLSDTTPIAIQQQPEKFWSRKFKRMGVNAEVFRNDIKVLSKILTEKSDGKKLIVGTALMNDNMMFAMKLRTVGDFEIKGNFIHKSASEDKLLLKGDEFFTPKGNRVALTDVGISGKYAALESGITEYIIASDYLTSKDLKLYLRTVLGEALKRCSSVMNRLSFKLVRHNKFALDGFCDCSKFFVVVEGQLRSLLENEIDGNAEVHSTGFINDLIYAEDGQLLIAGHGSFQDVHAISVPKFTSYEAVREGFGGCVPVDKKTFILFKSKENLS